jgi:hypothetical protein
MDRHVSTLPISNNFKYKLTKGGIETLNDLKMHQPTDLIKGYRPDPPSVCHIYVILLILL